MKENFIYLKDLAKKMLIDFKNGTKTMFKEFFNKEKTPGWSGPVFFLFL